MLVYVFWQIRHWQTVYFFTSRVSIFFFSLRGAMVPAARQPALLLQVPRPVERAGRSYCPRELQRVRRQHPRGRDLRDPPPVWGRASSGKSKKKSQLNC